VDIDRLVHEFTDTCNKFITYPYVLSKAIKTK
jgi:hypothetical protein